MESFKIVLHAAGNNKIGIGNLIRTYSLGCQLYEDFEKKIILIFECNEEICKFINKKNIQIEVVSGRDEALECMWKIKIEEKAIYIDDLLDMDEKFEKRIRDLGFYKIVHLNDTIKQGFKPNLIIDGDIFKKNDCYKNNNIKIIGSGEYHIIKDDILKKRPEKNWDKSTVENVLVCFGGADPAEYTELLISEVKKGKYRNLKYNIILGPEVSKERKKNIYEMGSNNSNIRIMENIFNIAEKILEVDIVISLGGGIAYEAMYLGIPNVAIEWKYMTEYTRKLDEINVLKNLSPNNMIKELVEYVKNLKEIKMRMEKAWNLLDGQAAKRIAKYLKSNF